MTASMNALLVAHGLERTYAIRTRLWSRPARLRAVGGVSFAIAPGRTLAVVGESGCGKSTLGRLAALIEKPTAGTLRLGGIDAIAAPRRQARELRRSVQLVFQNPYGSLNPRRTVGAVLAEPLAINTDLSKAERVQAVRAMMAKVGLAPEHYSRYPHMFSGGQRQRIAIARALMLEPQLVVADEPVSALDVSVQAQVLNLFMRLQEEMGLAYLFISHDLAVVSHIAHEILVMYLGLAMEQGPKAAILARPLHPYTRALLAAMPGRLDLRDASSLARGEPPSPLDPPRGCVFATRCPHVAQRCRDERPNLRPIDGREVACHFAEQFAGAAAP
jgi:dipeptide transport system ATP-binding protein